MGLKEKLDLIESAKKDIRNKIIDKGVYVPESTPFKEYPNYINNIEANPIQLDVQEWTPDPLWWDIETIIQNDTNEGEYAWLDECGKMIVLYNDVDNTISFSVCNKTVSQDGRSFFAVKTSDGQIYTNTSNTYSDGTSMTHTWDRSKDKQSSNFDKKTRYAIFYKDKTLKVNTVSGMCNNALFVINDGLLLRADNTDSNASYRQWTLEAFIEKSGNITSDNEGRYFFPTEALKYIEFSTSKLTSEHKNSIKTFAKKNDTGTIKLGNDTCWLTDGLKTYELDSNNDNKEKTIDVTDIDFTDCYKNIFTNTAFKKIKGIINLENNTVNTDYYLFNSSYFSAKCVFSLNLPPNANVQINTRSISYETAKYLVENAPTITESHTLKLYYHAYQTIKNMPHNMPINYNGETYSDGIQVLTKKGWTVQQL